LDYGEDWSRAWKEHVENWKPQATKDYVYANEANSQLRVLKTPEELETDPYPWNLETSCFFQSDGSGQAQVRWDSSKQSIGLPKDLVPCRVLERSTTSEHYVVQVPVWNPQAEKSSMQIVTHVPQEAIRFTDKLYSTDQHLPSGFRHEIAIPDFLFPPKWMDRI
jgi:hypothetical protein